jgi:hypothetical protein
MVDLHVVVVVDVAVDFDGDGDVNVAATVDDRPSTSTLPSLDPAQVSGSIRSVRAPRRKNVRGA